MQMTTRNQIQTHLSRLLDLASQPCPPLKPTFWDNLDIDGRQASVDQERSWGFNDDFAWDPIGPVKDEWNDTIYPKAIKPLLRDNTRKVYKGVKRQIPYSVCCWMIGREWHSSHPAAIIICGNKKATKNAVKLIEGHGELARTWGFRVYGYESKISLTMGTSASEHDDDEIPLCAISGTRFTVGGQDGISTRMATLGGSIVIDGEYFGVTVAHPFMELPKGESSDDDESDVSDDDSEVTDITSCPNPIESIALESDVAFVEDPISHRRRILGSIPSQSRFDYFSQSEDWALPKLSPASLAINLLTLGDKLVVPSSIPRSFPGGELWVAVDPAKPVQTKASPSICGLFTPFSGMQDVWAIKLKPTPGNCGSWVVDAPSRALSGIIVAGSESNNVSYALPAHVIFDEIRARFPSMQLQSLQDIATLPVSTFVDIIYKAKELDLTQFVNEVVSMRGPLDDKDSSGYNPLCCAVFKGYEAAVASFLKGGASAHSVGTGFNMRPLALAAQKGHMAIVKLLLSASADPNSLSDYRESTPLIIAAGQGHREITHLLLASGARVNSCDALGSTPLAAAAQFGDEEVIRILIASGADINKRDIRGRSPLIEAALFRNEKAARVLLEKGADVDCVDDTGNTPLLLAAESDDPSFVELLIEKGAQVNVRSKAGNTPLIIAVTESFAATIRDEIVSTLLEHKADPDIQDQQGDTPLSLAIAGGLVSTVKILLDYKASMHIPNSLGKTPWSSGQQDENIARMLHIDTTSLDDKHGKRPLVYPPRFYSMSTTELSKPSLQSKPSTVSEPAEERKQEEKKEFEESMRDMDESMANLDTESRCDQQ